MSIMLTQDIYIAGVIVAASATELFYDADLEADLVQRGVAVWVVAPTYPATGIGGATVTGLAVLTAVDAAAARTAIGVATGTGDMLASTYDPNSDGVIALAQGGTGATTASAARTALGLGTAAVLAVPASGNAASGEVVKGSDTRLSDSRTPSAHTHPSSAISDATATGIAVLTAVDASAARAAIGVGTGTGDMVASTYDPNSDGVIALAQGGTGATTASAARTALGLGTAAVLNVGTTANLVVQLDGSARLPAVDGSQLTGLSSAPVSSVAGRIGAVVLSNTDISGLGTAAVLDVGTVANRIVQLNGSAQLPAVDGSLLTGLPSAPVSSVAGRTGAVVLANTDISGLGTAAVLNVGTTANLVVQLDGSARLPAVDGSLLTGLPSAPVSSVAGRTGAVVLTSTDVSLGSVTNDAQTRAAIVPNTAPSAGQLLVGNAGGTAYAPVAASGDATVASTGAITLATSGISAGTYRQVTVDAKGRATAGSVKQTRLVTSLSSASTSPTFTILGDTTDVCNVSATGSAGTVTFAAPSPSTPTDGEQIEIRLTTTNGQTLAFNAIFVGSTTLALPSTSSGGGLIDKMLFEYNSGSSKWQLQATNFGF